MKFSDLNIGDIISLAIREGQLDRENLNFIEVEQIQIREKVNE